jgi:hypothetical protein
MLLNSTLASGLGRPDLAYSDNQAGAVATLTPPAGAWPGTDSSSDATAGRGPIISLWILTAGLVVYVWWLRKHMV